MWLCIENSLEPSSSSLNLTSFPREPINPSCWEGWEKLNTSYSETSHSNILHSFGKVSLLKEESSNPYLKTTWEQEGESRSIWCPLKLPAQLCEPREKWSWSLLGSRTVSGGVSSAGAEQKSIKCGVIFVICTVLLSALWKHSYRQFRLAGLALDV